MSGSTSIEWTDATWNPTRGCSRVSEGCRNCYAERTAIRQVHGAYAGLVRSTPAGPRWTGAVVLQLDALNWPATLRKPRRIFVNSMSDLFHESLGYTSINSVFAAMGRAPQHTFQILTKRAARMADFFRWARIANATVERWPLPNVWLGVSVEDHATLNRIDNLRRTPAAVRFISFEPLLEDLGRVDLAGIQHAIIGGESGPHARPCDVAWIRRLLGQCRKAGLAPFVKQMGSNVRDRNDRLATDRPAPYPDMWPEPECGWDDGPRGNWEEIDSGCYQGAPIRIRLQDRKGGDPTEWPEDLRVRKFPP